MKKLIVALMSLVATLAIADVTTLTYDTYTNALGQVFTSLTKGYAGDGTKVVTLTDNANSTVTLTTDMGSFGPMYITAAAAATNVSFAGFSAGKTVVLVNVGTNAITIADGGATALNLSGAIALGAEDTLTIHCISDTRAVGVATSNN